MEEELMRLEQEVKDKMTKGKEDLLCGFILGLFTGGVLFFILGLLWNN